MASRTSTWLTSVGAGLALWVTTAGCQSVRLPAIDPTGQRIFLPPPASTTLVQPELPECRLPTPAFRAPAEPPPCPEGLQGTPGGSVAGCRPAPGGALGDRPPGTGPRATDHHGGARYGRLIVQPGRVIAPVGTEVVLIAGLCDPDGHYVVGQPLEWLLSQDSVGHFVDVAASDQWSWMSFRRPARKFGSNYAVTRTLAKAVVHTRGTAQTDDDFLIKRGQTWASVTSASEGISYVTVWAPQAEGWDMRRQTAVIHWVDAQWQFPPPSVARAGQPHILRVRVTHANGAPAEGWRVRFELVDGPAAGFAPSGAKEAVATVDRQGDAQVQVVPQTNQPGVTRVRMQVIRPGRQAGEPSELVVGEGWTTVTWSAAGLTVQVSGPTQVTTGETMSFAVVVTNVGDLFARNVVLRDVLPPSWRRLDANPPAQPMGDTWQWNVGDIAPGDSRSIHMRCQALQDGMARYCFQALSEGAVQAEGCADVDVFTPQLQLRVLGPETAVAGTRITFQIELTNTGRTPLTNVTLLDRFDPGLQHSEGQTSPIERSVGTLAPGQTRSDLAVTFIVVAAGRWCHTVEARADGGHRAAVERCVIATPPAAPTPTAPAAPALQIRKSGPSQLEVGQTGLYVIEIRNTGPTAVTGIRITDRYDRELRPVQATTGAVASEGGQAISWTLREIPPGAVELREVECRAVRPAEAAVGEVTVTTTEGFQEKVRTSTRITGEAPRESMDLTPPATPNGAALGSLRVNLVALDNPVRVGQPARFLLEIQNAQQESDRNVAVTFLLPADVKVQRVAGPGVTSRLAGTILRFEPVAEIRPAETLRPPYEVEIVPDKPGRIRLTAQIESSRSRQPIEVHREIDVNQ